MTVVAGSLTPQGALIAADTRVSWVRPNGVVYHDNAIKLSKIGDSSVFGFSGDVETAALLQGEAMRQVATRRRQDAVSLSRWLPRFFRTTFRGIKRIQRVGTVSFLVGGTIPGRPLRLKVSDCHRAVKQLDKLGLNNWTFMRAWAQSPDLASAILGDCDEQDDREFDLRDSCTGILYTMHSPLFVPRFVEPLGFAAIGSGKDGEEILSLYQPMLAHGDPGMAHFWFLDALSNYLCEEASEGIGGALLCALLTHGSVKSVQMEGGTKDRPNGFRVRMDREGTFVRTPDGHEIRLKWPSELVKSGPVAGETLELKGLVARTTLAGTLRDGKSVYDHGFDLIDPADGARKPITLRNEQQTQPGAQSPPSTISVGPSPVVSVTVSLPEALRP